ncbi:hypothetical protein ACVFYP_22555 [Roseomonas sp. F4]
MDDQAFRRERMLASGLLREPSPAELDLLTRLAQRQGEERMAKAALVAPLPAAALASLPPRPGYRRIRSAAG